MGAGQGRENRQTVVRGCDGGGRCRPPHPYLIHTFLHPLPLSSPPAGRWRGWLAYSPSFPCPFFSLSPHSHLSPISLLASCGLACKAGGAGGCRLPILLNFTSLLPSSLPFPRGPLAEPAPPAEKHPSFVVGGRSCMPKWSGRLSGGDVAQGEQGNRKGRKWAELRSTIIANYQAAKTCKNS